MRLIDADAYEKSIHVFYGDDGLQEINPDEVFIKLHEAQTVDAVPVVRCKDCKWYDLTHPYGTIVPDAFHCKVNDRFYGASHFCGYGERRA